ncbi:MAG TPA: SPOR domain-containing protein [Steroidobacteraceae bacterium]|jgi:DedD protein|nr:SPOR domain-containing protein [Steroidobacteraceae bacterium]
MDSRAKQRLTGAVILVALFVLLVPELLTGPSGADVPAGTPNDEGMRRYTIDLNASTPSAQPENSKAPQPAVVLPPVAESAQANPGEAAVPVQSVPEVQPDNVPAEKPAPKPVVALPAMPVETPRPAAPVPVERGSFVVQLGSFGSRDNADRLVRDMTAKGFAAFVAPITSGGRELYRVRVGPTRDRGAAEALAAQLRRVGQSGSIVPIS